LLHCIGATPPNGVDEDDTGGARRLYGESLSVLRAFGNKRDVVEVLEGLAGVAVSQARPEPAVRLFGTAEGLREAMGASLPPADCAEVER
jgi:hypothetical protein